MITKSLPIFSFINPTSKWCIIQSHIVVGETRAVRAIWTPEMAQDLQAFHNIDAEAELTALLNENIRHEIDTQILNDLRVRGWDNLFDINRGLLNNRPVNDFNNIGLPLTRRVGLDLVQIQPLELPNGLINYIDYNYGVLPNEEGWYTNNTWESILINMYLKPHKFITNKRTRRNRGGHNSSFL
jgi:hypothetical protein